ncbi:MAG TPA: SCE4755 family polysaccharide monooxygenase-like protein, partial [Polyangia bacterium]
MSRQAFVALALSAAGLLVPAAAHAHFKLNAPTSWWTQTSDGTPQKTPPCGNEGAMMTAASGVVNSVVAGQQVAVTVQATIAHPGWWRISLKQGASSTQTATSLPDPPVLSGTNCTPAFIDNPVWSPTQPVLVDKLGIPAGSTQTNLIQMGTQTFMVTIPSNANCTTASPCTLQVMMFMTDHPKGMCNYHHCADIAVTGSTAGTGGAGGATGAGGAGARGGSGGRGGAGGTNTTGAGGMAGRGGTTGNGGTSASGSGGTPGTGGDAAGAGGGGGSSTTGTGGSSTTGTGGSNTTGTGGSNATGSGGSNATGSGGSNTAGAGGSA